jgi:hypothetical protein
MAVNADTSEQRAFIRKLIEKHFGIHALTFVRVDEHDESFVDDQGILVAAVKVANFMACHWGWHPDMAKVAGTIRLADLSEYESEKVKRLGIL